MVLVPGLSKIFPVLSAFGLNSLRHSLNLADIIPSVRRALLVHELGAFGFRVDLLGNVRQLFLLCYFRTAGPTLGLVATVHLPLHELSEGAFGLVRQLLVSARLGYFAV